MEVLKELSEYYNPIELGLMTKREAFDAWLRVNGIIGMTEDIIDALEDLTILNINGNLGAFDEAGN